MEGSSWCPVTLRTVRFGGFLGHTLQMPGYTLCTEVAHTHLVYFRNWFYVAIRKRDVLSSDMGWIKEKGENFCKAHLALGTVIHVTLSVP